MREGRCQGYNRQVKVSDLGEFGLIQRLAERVAAAGGPPQLLLGIGDDTAAWREAAGVSLITTDTLIERVHFPPGVPWWDVGWKALAVNVSDVAAMGGMPAYALVTLALPPQLPVAAVDELYEGLLAACQEYGVTVIGGDVVRAPVALITVALWGRAQEGPDGAPRLLTRGGAARGDAIAVTGHLGDSAAGLRLLLAGRSCAADQEKYLRDAHLRPRPPLAVGRIAAQVGVRAAIDISDGLLQDLGHVCRASSLGAVVEATRLPLSPALRAAFPEEALALACSGGEDYQLLLTAPPDILAQVTAKSPLPITVIGHMVEDEEKRPRLVDGEGRELSLAQAGWDHLAGGGD